MKFRETYVDDIAIAEARDRRAPELERLRLTRLLRLLREREQAPAPVER